MSSRMVSLYASLEGHEDDRHVALILDETKYKIEGYQQAGWNGSVSLSSVVLEELEGEEVTPIQVDTYLLRSPRPGVPGIELSFNDDGSIAWSHLDYTPPAPGGMLVPEHFGLVNTPSAHPDSTANLADTEYGGVPGRNPDGKGPQW